MELTQVVSEVKAANEQYKADLQAKFAQETEQIKGNLQQLQEELAKKGATLEEIAKAQQELIAKAGRNAEAEAKAESTASIISKGIAEHFAEIKTGRKTSWESKAVGTMTAANNLTGSVQVTYGLSPAVRGRRKFFFRDVVQVFNSATGLFSFYRQNTPVGEGSIDWQTTHGADKAQLDYDLTQVNINVDYLAGHTTVAKQMLQDLPFLQTFVASELQEDYMRTESTAFTGSLVAGATGSATTTGANTAEKIIDYLANLYAADYDPNVIMTTAAGWASLMKTKPSDYGTPANVTVSPLGEVMFNGIPVYINNGLAAGKVLVGDFSRAAIIQADGLSIESSTEHNKNFIQNVVTWKIEARVALAILRPDAFVNGVI